MKTLIVATVAAASAAIGESLLSFGMRKNGSVNLLDPSHMLALLLSVVRNPYVFVGVMFLAVFFFLYLAALSWAELSYVLPLTALSYVFAAFLAKYFLGEDVTWLRWTGTAVIVIGIVIIALEGTFCHMQHKMSGVAVSENAQNPHSAGAGNDR